jgi:hypothetical protein
MSDTATHTALARIEAALARIEVASKSPVVGGESDSRYQALRARTQAALASLETVIAQVGAGGGRR